MGGVTVINKDHLTEHNAVHNIHVILHNGCNKKLTLH